MSARSWLGLAGLIAASAAWLGSGLTDGLSYHDEGVWLYESLRVLAGDVPYRDFWRKDAPGQCYLLAGLFAIVGPSVLAARILTRVTAVLIVVLCFCLARRLMPWPAALLAGALVALWLKTLDPLSGSPMVFATLASLLAFVGVARAAESDRTRWFAAAGGFTGLAAIFRHDVGAYTVVAIGAVLGARVLARVRRAQPWTTSGRHLLTFVTATVAVVAPVAIALVATVDVHTLVADLIVYSTSVYPAHRSLPWPRLFLDPVAVVLGRFGVYEFVLLQLERLQFYVPLAVLPVAAAVLVTIRRRLPPAETLLAAALLLFGVLSLNQLRIRTDTAHLFPVILPVTLLLVWLLAHARGDRRVVAAVAVAVVAASFAAPEFVPWRWHATIDRRALTLDSARGIRIARREADALEGAVRYVIERVPPGQRIFVGNGRHDRVFIGHTMFYVLAGRPSATTYHTIDAGVTTTRPVQQAMIAELERHDVRYAVLWTRQWPLEPNRSSESSGVRDLDEYLAARYRVDRVFGAYTILARR